MSLTLIIVNVSILLYASAFYIIHKRYKLGTDIVVKDIIILFFAPVSIIPILIMPIMSIFIDLDTVVFKKQEK